MKDAAEVSIQQIVSKTKEGGFLKLQTSRLTLARVVVGGIKSRIAKLRGGCGMGRCSIVCVKDVVEAGRLGGQHSLRCLRFHPSRTIRWRLSRSRARKGGSVNIASNSGTRSKAKGRLAAPVRVGDSASLITEDAVAYDRVDEKTNVWFLTVIDKHG